MVTTSDAGRSGPLYSFFQEPAVTLEQKKHSRNDKQPTPEVCLKKGRVEANTIDRILPYRVFGLARSDGRSGAFGVTSFNSP
jgi:hypothetical protein